MSVAEQEKTTLTKEEKAKMKEKIRRCFSVFQICQEKHDEIRKFNQILEESRLLSEGKGKPCNERIMERITKKYMGEIRKVTEMIHEILDERRKFECARGCLSAEEEKFLLLRYEKHCDYTRICYEMHMSRSRCFRVQDKALLHLQMAFEKEEDGDESDEKKEYLTS